MKRIALPALPACLIILAPLAVTVAGAPFPAAAQAVWVAPPTTKVLPATPEGPRKTVDLAAVRNEWVAFQVVVTAGAGAITGVDASLSDLAGPAGAVVSGASAALYREYYVDLTKHNSYCVTAMNDSCEEHPEYLRQPGWYPDPLIPFRDPYGADPARAVGAPFDVAAGGTQVIFVDLFVPTGLPAGKYEGTFTVTGGGTSLAVLPVTLQILDVDLPTKRSMTTAYGFSYGAMKRYHGGPAGDAPTLERVTRNYELAVHQHRVDFQDHGTPPAFQFDGEGKLVPPDWTAYDAELGPRVDGTYFPDGAGITGWDLNMLRPGSGDYGWTEDQYLQVAREVASHFQAKGWLDRVYLYSSDEPWMPTHIGAMDRIVADVKRLRKATNLFDPRVMVTGPWFENLNDYVGIWCPDTAMYGDSFWPDGTWPGADFYAKLRQEGRQLWFYVCNANFPALMGYDVDSATGHEPRLLKWGAWAEGATGFLYWRMTYWMDQDPWNLLANVGDDGFPPEFARNGDGILVYPGDANGFATDLMPPPWPGIDGPILSYRLKQIRDGFEDWELLRLTASLPGGEAWVRKQVGRVYQRLGDPLDYDFDPANRPWSMDDAEVLDAWTQIALKAQYLLHPDQYADPEPPPAADEGPDVPDGAMPDAAIGDEGATDLAGPDANAGVDGTGADQGAGVDTAGGADVAAADPGAAADAGTDAGPGKKSGGGGCRAGAAGASVPWGLAWMGILAVFAGLRRRE